jgi:DNA-binding response OmpR family regulator
MTAKPATRAVTPPSPARERHTNRSRAVSADQTPEPQTRRVLVVDDDASVRESLTKVLKSAGYDVVTVADGQQALETFDPERTDLMLLDIDLPLKNGWETFERITTESPTLPIIIVTGQADQVHMAKEAGVGVLMEKPLDAPQLLQTIEELLIESKEARLRRLCGYRSDVCPLPSDSAAFLNRLRSQYETPLWCILPNRAHAQHGRRPWNHEAGTA